MTIDDINVLCFFFFYKQYPMIMKTAAQCGEIILIDFWILLQSVNLRVIYMIYLCITIYLYKMINKTILCFNKMYYSQYFLLYCKHGERLTCIRKL